MSVSNFLRHPFTSKSSAVPNHLSCSLVIQHAGLVNHDLGRSSPAGAGRVVKIMGKKLHALSGMEITRDGNYRLSACPGQVKMEPDK